MASELHMPLPVCLIENSQTEGLVVRQEALEVLAGVTQPVVVVAITGPYRTGKSYIMNRLARQRRGFSLGSSVQSQTKGLWMWCLPHPRRQGHTLVLLDTEGLGDVEKGDTQNDTWLFVLAILLSSTLIYNSRGTIDQPAMEQLHYVMELTERVKLKAAPRQSEEDVEDCHRFVSFFPTFVWAVRDFTLQLEVDGREISEDQYLENALRLRAGSGPETERYNYPRQCIRQFFPRRKCFVFDQPAGRRDLARLEELSDDDLDPEFRQQLERFCGYIWEEAPPKSIPGGQAISGSSLGKLAETYVETMKSGAVPCVESAVLVPAKMENEAAVAAAVQLYRELTAQRVQLPTETLQELLELHSQCEREALELFMARVYKEDICPYQAELLRQLQELKEELCQRNKRASRDKCRAALRDLSQDMERRLRDGAYSVPGGYQLFEGDQRALVEKYRSLPGKGVEADAVLQEFLQGRETLAESILRADRSLTEREKELKRAEEQRKRAEQEREVERKKAAEDQQKLQDEIQRQQAHLLQLRNKLEECSEKELEELQRMISHKLEEERALRREGCHEQANQLHQVASRLQQELPKSWEGITAFIQGALEKLASFFSRLFRQ